LGAQRRNKPGLRQVFSLCASRSHVAKAFATGKAESWNFPSGGEENIPDHSWSVVDVASRYLPAPHLGISLKQITIH
jgi:hypothetical protein